MKNVKILKKKPFDAIWLVMASSMPRPMWNTILDLLYDKNMLWRKMVEVHAPIVDEFNLSDCTHI